MYKTIQNDLKDNIKRDKCIWYMLAYLVYHVGFY